VYYTKERPDSNNSPRVGAKRPYTTAHGAIFQAPCTDTYSPGGSVGRGAQFLLLDEGGRQEQEEAVAAGQQLRGICGQMNPATTAMQLACECDFRSS
jgi:hypothetical protein